MYTVYIRMHDDPVSIYEYWSEKLIGCFVADIDDCVGVNCNDGVCVDGIAEYECNCNKGYTGDHCQTGNYITTPK